MNNSTFSSCALILLAKADELCEGHVEPGYYASNPALLAVTRTADGYWAGIVDYDYTEPCHKDWLVRTSWYANEQAALVRLGIMLQDELDKQSAAQAA